MTRPEQPIDRVQWVPTDRLHANDFNPNRVFGKEWELLKQSILNTGWTMPIVALEDGTIVDGFHRWTMASKDSDVRERLGGECPVVFVDVSPEEHKLATVRHNRARGYHGLRHMASIIQDLGETMGRKEIIEQLGMDEEEFDRFSDVRTTAEIQAADSYGEGWIAVERKTKAKGDKARPPMRG